MSYDADVEAGDEKNSGGDKFIPGTSHYINSSTQWESKKYS
jgi:hypothetical protein